MAAQNKERPQNVKKKTIHQKQYTVKIHSHSESFEIKHSYT